MLICPVTVLCKYCVEMQQSNKRKPFKTNISCWCPLLTVHLLCCYRVFSYTQTHTDAVACFFSWFLILSKDTLTWELLDLEIEPMTLQLVADPLYHLRHCSLYVRLKISDWNKGWRQHAESTGFYLDVLFFSANSSSLYVTRKPHPTPLFSTICTWEQDFKGNAFTLILVGVFWGTIISERWALFNEAFFLA